MAANPSIQLGTDGNWAIKEGNLLAYKKDGNRFFNKEFDFSRGSLATFVGENGLIQESATNTPRIDFTNNATGHLLLEPQRTNLITYSEDFTQWIAGSNTSLTFVSDIVAPDGSLGVYRLTLPATSDTYLSSNAFTGQNPLALSIYAKSVNTNNDFNFYDGNSPSPTKTASNEWQRFDYVGNGNQLIIVNSGDTFETDIYIWGAQAEARSYPTSYIPTSGSTVTRSAEVCNNSGSEQDFNDSEGVLYAEIAALVDNGTPRRLSISDGTNNDRVLIGYSSSNRLQYVVSDGGSVVVNKLITVDNITAQNKTAFKYKLNDCTIWINGFEIDTDTVATMPSGLNTLNFDQANGTEDFYGKTKELAVFKRALTDLELESLTSWDSFIEMATELEYTIE